MFDSSFMLKTLIGQLVVHAERERRRVHDLQAALERVAGRDLGDELGVGSCLGSAV